MADAMNARSQAGAAVLEEAIRPYSPLIRDTTLSPATVITNPFGTPDGAVPADGEGGRRAVPNDPSGAGAGSNGGLSGGAIAGIVLGSLVGVALLAAGAAAVATKQKEAAEKRRAAEAAAAARRTGRGINVGETAGQGDDVNASALHSGPAVTRGKAFFQPRHANRQSDAQKQQQEAEAAALAAATTAAAAPAAGTAQPTNAASGENQTAAQGSDMPAMLLAEHKPELAPSGGSPQGGSPKSSPVQDPAPEDKQ